MRNRLKRVVLIVAVLLLLAVMAVGLFLRGSLPLLEGKLSMAGISLPVSVLRDTSGVVTIQAETRADAAFATGFVHAQDRFFQMDLARRFAAGELAALVGAAALDTDKRQRRYQLRQRAAAAVAGLPDPYRQFLQAYVDGVNAGLSTLRARPFEYGLLLSQPQPWNPEDSVLVLASMYFDLQGGDAAMTQQLGRLQTCFEPQVAEFLAPFGGRWDTPVTGDTWPELPIPAADQFDLRAWPAWDPESDGDVVTEAVAAVHNTDFSQSIGSNNWAVNGASTRSGAALVANDMHLGLSVPHIWYRLRLQTHTLNGESLDITGVSLPGMPFVVVGSNTRIAWGFTNSYGDWSNVIRLQRNSDNPNQYLTAVGYADFEASTEVIQVSGADAVDHEVLQTRWGPVIDDDYLGQPAALQWVALSDRLFAAPGLLELEHAQTVDQALAAAARATIPAQNLVVGDRSGAIGWTIMGPIPQRENAATERLPISWQQADSVWHGWLPVDQYPRFRSDSYIVTANSRVVSDSDLEKVGYGHFALGARARQVRDGVSRAIDSTAVDSKHMHAIQLDDAAVFLAPWYQLLLRLLNTPGAVEQSDYQQLRTLLLQADQRASADSIAYRLVRAFRDTVSSDIYGSIMRVCDASELHEFRGNSQAAITVWRLVSEQPDNWLDNGYPDWDTFLLSRLDKILADAGELEKFRWGERNTLHMQHPLASAIPLLGRLLNMPQHAQPGDRDMPRVAGPGFGQSQRMAVVPGQEASGYMTMPGGQSGHPLSPFYNSLHDDWANDRKTPFLPGMTQHTLTLIPSD